MRYKNTLVRRYAVVGTRSAGPNPFATTLQLVASTSAAAAFSKIEARISYVDKTLLYLAEVRRVQAQELVPPRTPGNAFATSWRSWRQRDLFEAASTSIRHCDSQTGSVTNDGFDALIDVPKSLLCKGKRWCAVEGSNL
jgi:hypothetical protein